MMNALEEDEGRVSKRCFCTELEPYHICCNCVGFHKPDSGLVVDSVMVVLPRRKSTISDSFTKLWRRGRRGEIMPVMTQWLFERIPAPLIDFRVNNPNDK